MEGRSARFPCRGVFGRQGCPIAPIVFAAWSCRLCKLVNRRLSRAWMDEHGTLFADDIFSCWKLRTVQAFKSVVVLRLCGVAVVQVCKGYIWFSVTGSSIFAFDAHTMTCTSPVSLRCRIWVQHCPMSYDNFELQNFKTRAAQAKSRFQELKQVLRTDGAITCRHRLRLCKAIIWPTLWYALASVGVTVDVLRGVCSLLSVQLRKVLGESQQPRGRPTQSWS